MMSRYDDWDLFDAVDALAAYACGATDSGISDPSLWSSVARRLNEKGRPALEELADACRERAMPQEDTEELIEWVDSHFFPWKSDHG